MDNPSSTHARAAGMEATLPGARRIDVDHEVASMGRAQGRVPGTHRTSVAPPAADHRRPAHGGWGAGAAAAARAFQPTDGVGATRGAAGGMAIAIWIIPAGRYVA